MAEKSQSWILLPLLETTTSYFRSKGVESPRVDAELLLAHLLGKKRIELYVAFDRPMTRGEVDRFRGMVRERASGKPVQRIVGETEFYALPLAVAEGVLVPRPETEILIDEALAFLRESSGGERRRAFDAGTGTGAIAVALAANVPGLEVVAMDQAPEAVRCASENAERNGVAERLTVEMGDCISYLEGHEGEFDLIASNPPYVTTEEVERLPKEVKLHDPFLALHGGDDGLDLYRKLVPAGSAALREKGALLLEVSDTVSECVVDLMKNETRLHEIRVRRDYSGRDRVVFGRGD